VGLDVATNDRFERRWHVFEVAAWAAMAVVVLAALLGGLGGGLIGRDRIHASGVVLELDRIGRYHTPNQLVVRNTEPTPTVQVRLPGAIMEKLDVTRISPRPLVVASDGDGVVFRFAAGNAGRFQFTLEPQTVGLVAGWVTVGATPVRFRQLVLP
jgi:hypothetical protein